jgi:hypothetical protein
MVIAPQIAPHQSQRIREGRLRFPLPRYLAYGARMPLTLFVGQQRDRRIQVQLCKCCEGNSPVVPLALGFQTQIGSALGPCHLHLPTPDKPLQHLARVYLQLRIQQGLGLTLLGTTTDHHPTHRTGTGGIPE